MWRWYYFAYTLAMIALRLVYYGMVAQYLNSLLKCKLQLYRS